MMLDDAEEGQLKGPIVVLAPYTSFGADRNMSATGSATSDSTAARSLMTTNGTPILSTKAAGSPGTALQS